MYQVSQNSSGAFEVREMQPVVLGTFQNVDLARKFLTLLEGEKRDASGDVVGNLAKPEPKPEPKPKPTPATQPSQSTALALVEWTEDELQDAFTAIRNGASAKDIAAAAGKSFPSLRGKWAAHRRQIRKTASEADKESCRLCATEFVPTADRLDICARCSNA